MKLTGVEVGKDALVGEAGAASGAIAKPYQLVRKSCAWIASLNLGAVGLFGLFIRPSQLAGITR